MGKVRLFIGMSLDGYIARQDNSVDWLLHDKDYGHTAFYKTVHTVIMGRNTYELMVNRWGYQFKDKTGYVISRTCDGQQNKEVRFVGKDIPGFLKSLCETQDIWLVGGGQLTQSLLREHLIDEMTLLIHPTLLGSGIPLFLSEFPTVDLNLLELTTHQHNGLIQAHYALVYSNQATS